MQTGLVIAHASLICTLVIASFIWTAFESLTEQIKGVNKVKLLLKSIVLYQLLYQALTGEGSWALHDKNEIAN